MISLAFLPLKLLFRHPRAAGYLILAVIAHGIWQDATAYLRHGLPAVGRRAGLVQAAPSAQGRAEIPADYLRWYRSAAASQCPGLDWRILAGIGKVESNHGQSNAQGVHSGENYAGAGGPMQFLTSTWAEYGRGGNRYDPQDAIPAAARLLCNNNVRGNPRGAIYAYNHAGWYVDRVLTQARKY